MLVLKNIDFFFVCVSILVLENEGRRSVWTAVYFASSVFSIRNQIPCQIPSRISEKSFCGDWSHASNI